MASLQKAYLATMQRFREYYDDVDGYELALRPATAIDEALVERLTVEEWPSPGEQKENQFLVATLCNEIIKEPYKYMELGNGNMTWDIYQSALDVSETTSELARRYNDAIVALDIDSDAVVTDQGTFRYKRTGISNPTWEEETIDASEFGQLISEANKDSVFIEAFNETYGQDDDLEAMVTLVRFKKAEVKINRAWLDNNYLFSRNWRLKAQQTVGENKTFLSSNEAGKEFDGAMPGYPEKLIFIKDVEMTFQLPDTEGTEETAELMENGHIINFGPILLNQMVKVPSKGIYRAKGLATTTTFNRLIKASLYNNLQIKSASPVNPPKPTSTNTPTGGIRVRPSTSMFNTIRTNPSIKTTPASNFQHTTSPIKLTTKPLQLNFQQASVATKSSYFQTLITKEQPKFNVSSVQHINWKQITQQQKVVVKGRVKKKGAGALANAEVLVTYPLPNGQESVQKVNTNANGDYSLKVNKEVTFKLAVSKEGYETKLRKNLKSGTSTQTVNVNLAPVPVLKEQKSDIQLLAVLYRKLGSVPNPVDDFVALVDEF